MSGMEQHGMKARDAAHDPAHDPAVPHDLAVVIVNHNTAGHLEACLDSLAAGGLAGVDAEVWMVDNASRDDSVAMVRRRFSWVRVIESPDNLGFAAANNLALRAVGFCDAPGRVSCTTGSRVSRDAKPMDLPKSPPPPAVLGERAEGRGPVHAQPPTCRHALLLNPDTLVPPGALAKLLEALLAEEDIGIVGPKLVLSDGSLDLACRRAFPTPELSFYRFSGLSRLFPRSKRFGRYNMTYLDPDSPADVDAVVGACMLLRGAAIAAAGLLDERFWMYGEDLDLALRIHQAGWRVVYRPQVVIHHVKRAASRGSPQARFEFQRAMWLFYQKHYAATTPRIVHGLVLLGLGLRGGPRLWREMRAAGVTP